jgi:hypothetical protein
MTSRTLPLVALALVAGLGLAGCTGGGEPAPSASSSAPAESPSQTASSPAPTEVETPTETPTSSPTATATATGPQCDTIVTSDQLYGYNPNFAAVDAPGAGAGTTSCAWSAGSKDQTVTLVLARGTASGSGTRIPGYRGTFDAKTGTAAVTLGGYAVTVASPMFGTVDDAIAFLDLVKENVG